MEGSHGSAVSTQESASELVYRYGPHSIARSTFDEYKQSKGWGNWRISYACMPLKV
jgi:hypothetical protein